MIQRCSLVKVEDAISLVSEGRTLAIFGPSRSIESLPRGNWIGAEAMLLSPAENQVDEERLIVTDLSDLTLKAVVQHYSSDTIDECIQNRTTFDFTFLIIPGESKMIRGFYRSLLETQALTSGLVAGHLDRAGRMIPAKIYSGLDGTLNSLAAVALHIRMPQHVQMRVVTVSQFDHRHKPVIEVFEDSCVIANCRINGRVDSLYEHIQANGIDIRTPLMFVWRNQWHHVNVISLDHGTREVRCNLPLLAGQRYYFSRTVENYSFTLRQRLRDSLRRESSLYFCAGSACYYLPESVDKGLGSLLAVGGLAEIASSIQSHTISYLTVESLGRLSFLRTAELAQTEEKYKKRQ